MKVLKMLAELTIFCGTVAVAYFVGKNYGYREGRKEEESYFPEEADATDGDDTNGTDVKPETETAPEDKPDDGQPKNKAENETETENKGNE